MRSDSDHEMTMLDNLDIEAFLHPLSPSIFFESYWERQVCEFKRRAAAYHNGVFSIAELDSLIGFCLRGDENALALMKAGAPRPKKEAYYLNGRPDITRVYQAYENGYTVVINSTHLRSNGVCRLCAFLESYLGHPTSANLYLTPPASQGGTPHFDDHDVFVLQLDGSKTWRLYEQRPVDLPLPGASKSYFADIKAAKPRQVLCLAPGDMLYVPRGYVHEALATESFSLHLTVGVDVLRVVDALLLAIQNLGEQEAALRKAIPVLSQGTDCLVATSVREFISALDIDAVLLEAFSQMRRRIAEREQPVPDGQFMCIVKSARIGLDTLVGHRSSGVKLVKSEGTVQLEFCGATISAQQGEEHAFQFIGSTRKFRVRELPALDGAARITLIRTLVRQGFLYAECNQAAESAEIPEWPGRQLHESGYD